MKQETVRFFVWVVIFSLALLGAAVLSGCSELKYYECIARDNTRNPCN